MKDAAELAEVWRREGNVRWLHLWKEGAKSLNFRKRSRGGPKPERRKFNVFATSGVATEMKRLRMALSWSLSIAQRAMPQSLRY
jgi:hypothetical protein